MADSKKSSIGGKNTCHLLNIKKPERTAKRLKLSFQRTHAMISALNNSGKQMDASLTLIDVSETGVGLFTEKLLPKGSTVQLSVTEPRVLNVSAVVAWSVPVASGIMARKYPFRAGLQFLYENEIQRTAVIEFIQRIEMQAGDLPKPPPGTPTHFTSEDPPLADPNAPAAPVTPAAEASPAETPAVAAAPVADSAPAPVTEAPAAPAAEAAPAPAVEAPAAETPAAVPGDDTGNKAA